MSSHVRPAILLATLPLLLGLVACGGGDSPTAPEPPAALVRATVDADGGELAADDIRLTVPAGALTAEADLAIYVEASPNPFAPGAGRSTASPGCPSSSPRRWWCASAMPSARRTDSCSSWASRAPRTRRA
ncbi:MAG: hypothetical protein R3D98_10415 [Candidatus Krumholzibacteriia bacterium]